MKEAGGGVIPSGGLDFQAAPRKSGRTFLGKWGDFSRYNNFRVGRGHTSPPPPSLFRVKTIILTEKRWFIKKQIQNYI